MSLLDEFPWEGRYGLKIRKTVRADETYVSEVCKFITDNATMPSSLYQSFFFFFSYNIFFLKNSDKYPSENGSTWSGGAIKIIARVDQSLIYSRIHKCFLVVLMLTPMRMP